MRLAPPLMALIALLVALVAAAPERAAARCARALWVPTLVTPTDQPLPVNATFLVALMLEFDMQNQALEGRFPEDATLVREVNGEPSSDRIALRVVPLGAGLARYEPASRPRAGVYRLEGLGRPRSITFGGRRTLRVTAPQAPNRVQLMVGPTRVQTDRGGVVTTRAVRATLQAETSGPPTALIAFWDGEPGAAAVIPSGTTEVLLFRENIHCASPLGGTRVPRAGELRELAAVDAFGRISRRVTRP